MLVCGQTDFGEGSSFAVYIDVEVQNCFGHHLECEPGTYFGTAIVGQTLANEHPQVLNLRNSLR